MGQGFTTRRNYGYPSFGLLKGGRPAITLEEGEAVSRRKESSLTEKGRAQVIL